MSKQWGHRFAVPMAIDRINTENYAQILSELRAGNITRVWLCCVGAIYEKNSLIYQNPAHVRRCIDAFRADGFEVGVWIGGFGHGCVLGHESRKPTFLGDFTCIEGLDGRTSGADFCPMDAAFRAVYAKGVAMIGEMGPDLIMLDDDFRLNVRDGVYDIGCFCPHHLAAFYARVGKQIPREQLRALLFEGGENRYRSAWLDVMGESLLDFAREMRKALDGARKGVRLGACMCYDTWDLDGTDGIALARAFAGDTKPFLRTIGAPYHDIRIGGAVESTRMQAAWCRAADPEIEIWAEGDVYPRPRTNVPANSLELFDMALLATGAVDGDQKYMMDYSHPISFEQGYMARHLKNAPMRDAICAFFAGKQAVGVQPFEQMHRVEKTELPATLPAPIGRFLRKGFQSRAAAWLSRMAVPTAYEHCTGQLMIFGENARYVSEKELQRGAILDVRAAELLQARGIDVGLCSADAGQFAGEYFPAEQDAMMGCGGYVLRRMRCAQGAQIDSVLLPDECPGAYRYENAAGQRFFVLAADVYATVSQSPCNYDNSYYRQRQLIAALEWVGRAPLPAKCAGNPYLYLIAARSADGSALSVLLLNVFEDSVLTPCITLDRAYSHVRFAGCEGTLCGNTVTLGELAPFGVAAFEVTV